MIAEPLVPWPTATTVDSRLGVGLSDPLELTLDNRDGDMFEHQVAVGRIGPGQLLARPYQQHGPEPTDL
jgi:hypothetical protein